MSARSHSSASERCSSGSAGTKRSAAAMNHHASGSSSSSDEDEENPRTQPGQPSFQPLETSVLISASLPAPLPTISPTQRASQRVAPLVPSLTEGDSGLSDVNSSREDGTHVSGRETPLSGDLLDADLGNQLGSQLGALFAPISPPPPPEPSEDAEADERAAANMNTSEWRSAACPSPTESISSAASATPSSCTSCSSCRFATGASLRRRKKRPSLQSEPGNRGIGRIRESGAEGSSHVGRAQPASLATQPPPVRQVVIAQPLRSLAGLAGPPSGAKPKGLAVITPRQLSKLQLPGFPSASSSASAATPAAVSVAGSGAAAAIGSAPRPLQIQIPPSLQSAVQRDAADVGAQEFLGSLRERQKKAAAAALKHSKSGSPTPTHSQLRHSTPTRQRQRQLPSDPSETLV